MKTEAAIVFESNFEKFKSFCYNTIAYGMPNKAGAVWPVIIRRWGDQQHRDDEKSNTVYYYPEVFFKKLMRVNQLYVYPETKPQRIMFLKFLVDEIQNGRIDIHLYHFGMNILYPYLTEKQGQDKESVGKRRSDFMNTLPRYEFMNNDDFISSIWSDMIERYYPEVGEEVVRVPFLKDIRILFTPDQLGNHTGTYFYDADWVEPIPGRSLQVKRWVGAKDPMTPEPKKEGMIEGDIILGHTGSGDGLRHFVEGKAIQAGSHIEVKFGDGWITGRYEWNFEQGSPIRIESRRGDGFFIKEGHRVRIVK